MSAATATSDETTANVATATLSRLGETPALRQAMSLVGIAAAVAIGLGAWMWSQQPGYAPLYTGLSDGDAAEITEALRAGDFGFRMESATGALLVPAAKVHDARMHLAAQGLPRSSGTGFELIRDEPGLGVSQFMESARYQHAIETELARTITSLQPVKSARVHLALPRPSAFSRNRRQASASVLVAMHAGRRLEKGQVAAIINLVGSSIPNLTAGDVTVIDQSGRLLSSPGDDDDLAMTSSQFEMVRGLEHQYVQRIEELLRPIVGADGVRAKVSLDVDFSVREETRESFDPDRVAVRSEQLSEENRNTPEAGGVPGAVSNRTQTKNSATSNAQSSRQSTRNFELDRTFSRQRKAPGRIARVSVAVLVDHVPRAGGEDGAVQQTPLSEGELEQIESLVREAVGFDTGRGDSVSVRNVSFIALSPPAIEEAPIWERPSVRELGRQLLGSLVLLIIAFAVLRPALRNVLNPASALAGPKAALPGAVDGQADGEAGGLQLENALDVGGGGVTATLSPAAAEAVAAGQPAPEGATSAPPDPRGRARDQSETEEEEEEEQVPQGRRKRRRSFDEELAVARSAVSEDPRRAAHLIEAWLNDESCS